MENRIYEKKFFLVVEVITILNENWVEKIEIFAVILSQNNCRLERNYFFYTNKQITVFF